MISLTTGETAYDQPIAHKSRYTKIKVLMYHRIVDDEVLCHNYPDMCLHVRDFRTHLILLERLGFTPITFEDYRLYKQGAISLPKRPIILTFDDGYEEIYKLGFPLLQEYGVKAVIFVLGDRSIQANIWDSNKSRLHIPLMNDVQLIELHAAGHEVGSHTLTHPRLIHLSKEKAWEEISRSRMLLEILLNAPVQTFSYPYGVISQPIKEMVVDAGYIHACAAYTGPPSFGSDPFEIRRLLITSSTKMTGFAMRLLPGYKHYRWARSKIKSFLFPKNDENNSPESIDESYLSNMRDYSQRSREDE